MAQDIYDVVLIIRTEKVISTFTSGVNQAYEALGRPWNRFTVTRSPWALSWG